MDKKGPLFLTVFQFEYLHSLTAIATVDCTRFKDFSRKSKTKSNMMTETTRIITDNHLTTKHEEDRLFDEEKKTEIDNENENEKQQQHQQQQQQRNHDDCSEDPKDHDQYRIALYYCYIDLGSLYSVDDGDRRGGNGGIGSMQQHVEFQRNLCERFNLMGRIRVSTEGLNGVLSGKYDLLKQYEQLVTQELESKLLLLLRKKQRQQFQLHHQKQKNTGTGSSSNDDDNDENGTTLLCQNNMSIDLDVKYCHLRTELSVESQLFDNLICKQTKTVISLCDSAESTYFHSLNKSPNDASTAKRNLRGRQRKKIQDKKEQRQPVLPFTWDEMLQAEPSQHLSAKEWNDKLDQAAAAAAAAATVTTNSDSNNTGGGGALLVDVRNVYESRVGHFATPNVPTLLTNTRKYGDLPDLLKTNEQIQSSNEIFMYCTGGVRCERVSQMVQTLYPEKQVYQLKGGIQTYLREVIHDDDEEEGAVEEEKDTSGSEQNNKDGDDSTAAVSKKTDNKFLGKNFVFDPRRTDPIFGASKIVGQCLICHTAHDDYDNGNAPSANKEARCNTCRMLILVCNVCRPNYICFGEESQQESSDEGETKPLLYCGGLTKCIHEGAAPEPELVMWKED